MKALDKIYSYADALCMHTKSGENLFHENYTAKTPISIVTQGFCLKSDYKRIDNAEAKKHFGIPQDSVVYLYYGTIRPSKGLNILISSIREAHAENPKEYLLAAGAFHHVDENEYKNMVAEKLDSSFSTVNFGFVPQAEEQWYFSAADVLCLPYLEVTQSGVAQLGLMYELPIIATNVGEMSEICRNEENGFLLEPGNLKGLTTAIIQFSRNTNFTKKASKESAILGETEFSLTIKAEKMGNVYKNL